MTSPRSGQPKSGKAAAKRPGPKAPVPYNDTPTDAELTRFERALKSAKATKRDGVWYWTVPCPRCNWQIQLVLAPIRYLDAAPEVQALCACSHTHKGRDPELKAGCGWDVMVPMTPPT